MSEVLGWFMGSAILCFVFSLTSRKQKKANPMSEVLGWFMGAQFCSFCLAGFCQSFEVLFCVRLSIVFVQDCKQTLSDAHKEIVFLNAVSKTC